MGLVDMPGQSRIDLATSQAGFVLKVSGMWCIGAFGPTGDDFVRSENPLSH